ncbi:fatty acid desaturase [Rubidibacter lacunae KORDI 51-2]|uniref:Fatty acid desaturase n=1 Tax=Rubidibacter lacunae KORDI 51-2 TaxID=582515 RepID=U5D871_9CHRO|nr:fatty acid desaturase [Rubidibacter lacunae]ERN40823.1 fatty acid desaturase [Rubidibacter lacunae KORDI 51-2]
MQVASVQATVKERSPSMVPREFVLAPGGWNPTVWLFLTSVAIFAASVGGYWLWDWPKWWCFWIDTLALHLAGTVIHDACHRAAHRNPILNAALGHGSALVLGFVYPVFTRVHLQHHAHVNDPENDPDHYVSRGGPLLFIPARFFYHEIFFFKRRLWRNYELLEWALCRGFIAALVILSLHYNFFSYLLNYWLSPALVVGWTLGLFFDYLPHRPFAERDRWKNARVYPSRILNLLILGQNYHLVHHLWPAIPWYKYEPAYHATRHILDEKGSPQCAGLLQSSKDFWGFVYDVFIGIYWHKATQSKPVDEPAGDPEQTTAE